MNKDKIIKLIEALHDHCKSKRCEECKFFTDANTEWRCDLREFTKLFSGTPRVWDIEKIKELL